jgi:hypothetical protein
MALPVSKEVGEIEGPEKDDEEGEQNQAKGVQPVWPDQKP